MAIPNWLAQLRRQEIIDVVKNHPTTHDDLVLNLSTEEIFNQVIGGGQADFDTPYRHLSGAERALLYAYFNQPSHLKELIEAFSQLFRNGPPQDPLIVVDAGCGPFTGGLALSAVINTPFSYIGVDRSMSMRDLGERLAGSAENLGALNCSDRQWVADFDGIKWQRPPDWRPILVIASYVLASPTLDVAAFVRNIERVCNLFGRGPATVLYTNSPLPWPNRNLDLFRNCLRGVGFRIVADDRGEITIDRYNEVRTRELRYALFQRDAQAVLKV
jgi:SAM-dependent methyltransferase